MGWFAKRLQRLCAWSSSLLLVTHALQAQAWLDRVDDALSVQTRNGLFRLELSGLLDLEGYYIDQRPPGLLFSDDQFFFNPRLSLFLDAQFGSHLYGLVQARFDRGFDPGAKPDGEARLDEYLLRYTPFAKPVLNLQAGKFSTVVGNWVPRHLSWDNPFINAPLPYENVLPMTDQTVPAGPGAFLARHDLEDRKGAWLPLIWGPSYATGASIFGSLGRFDYAAELKNASLSSRPAAWDGSEVSWDDPTVSGRVGFRPGPAWNLGLSASAGTYLLSQAEAPPLPPGEEIGEYNQFTLGQDVGFAWRHWQVWAEVFLSRFEVPNVGDADTLAYYLEAKYKLTPRLFLAARWNQQFFASVSDGAGGNSAWDNDAWRAEAAVGYRFTRHFQGKVQYSYNHQNGPLQQGEQLGAVQLTTKF